MITINLDTTRDLCPAILVRTRLYLERLKQGDVLEVLLKEGESLESVPKNAADQGYTIVGSLHVKDNIQKVIIQK